MGASQLLSSLSCEIKIIRAKNVELRTEGKLFVRCYLSAGNNQRVGLNSREISSNSDLFFDDSFSLECSGSEELIQRLMQERVVFELRWRSKIPVLGRVCKSRVLGRVEIPWESVFGSKEMEMEKWVSMVSTGGSRIVDEDCKPPAVQVAMKVRMPERSRRGRMWDECGCMGAGGGCTCTCVDADHIFALAVLEVVA